VGDATLNGTYKSMGGDVGPIAFVGMVCFDGRGGSINPFTGVIDGIILTETSAENFGTYSVDSDRNGTQILGPGPRPYIRRPRQSGWKQG